MMDSYEQLFQLISKKKFFNFGLDSIKCISRKRAKNIWEELLFKIENKDTKLFIRGLGRNGQRNDSVMKMYKDIFDIDINIDKTNNQKPTLLLEKGTGLKKQQDIVNYQVSHVFGRTKNVYCFTAPWNIVYIPKALDPFTGHEAKGQHIQEFQTLFQKKIYSTYKPLIKIFNKHMFKIQNMVRAWCHSRDLENKLQTLIDDFAPISDKY